MLIDLKDLVGATVPPWSGLAFMLIYTQQGLSQQELADQMGVSKFAASRVIRAYEERKIVVAKRDGRDKRLYLSPEGLNLGRTLAARCRAKLRRVALALP